ncbi:MAG: hypothetical protein ACT4QD_11165 [Acidobacteriota bacterium]
MPSPAIGLDPQAVEGTLERRPLGVAKQSRGETISAQRVEVTCRPFARWGEGEAPSFHKQAAIVRAEARRQGLEVELVGPSGTGGLVEDRTGTEWTRSNRANRQADELRVLKRSLHVEVSRRHACAERRAVAEQRVSRVAVGIG